jgi:hypothetical protein
MLTFEFVHSEIITDSLDISFNKYIKLISIVGHVTADWRRFSYV